MLTIEESRRLVPHQNATTMQVAISVVAAAMWMVENPNRGVCVPDDLPHEYVLGIARPYLGQSLSIPVRLDAAEALREQLPRLQPAGPRFRRPLAVQELFGHGWGLREGLGIDD